MKNILLIITLLLFVQCEELFDGHWMVPIKNVSYKDVMCGIDVNIINNRIYARESYFDPSDEYFDFCYLVRSGRNYHYQFLSKSSGKQFSRNRVQIKVGDTVSVYAIDPIDMEMYSWDEIREKKKYSFARVVLDAEDEFIYFPFELNK